MPVQNAEIAAMFDQAAELLEIGGENQFRVRAYRRAARVIEGLPKEMRSRIVWICNDLHAHAAKLAGVKLAVSTVAHSIDAFQCMRFGIDQARRAWLTTNDVLNTRSLAELRKLLKR